MCEPVTAGLLLSTIGGGTKFINQQAALRRQDRQAAEGIRRQGALQRGANVKVGQQIEDIAGSTGEPERAESLGGFLDALRAAEDTTTGALPSVPGASQRFAERVEGGKKRIATAGTERAGRLSRIDAPRFQRIGEGQRIGLTARDLGEVARQSRAEDFLTQLRVASERPNEFINALGSIASGAGSALTLGQGGGLLDIFKGKFNTSIPKLLKGGTLIDSPIVTPFAPPGLA